MEWTARSRLFHSLRSVPPPLTFPLVGKMRKLIPVAIGCLLLGLIWYWQTHLTYNGEVSHFEARVRKQVDPAKLQSWATDLIALHSTSQVAEASFPITTFPDYLRNLHKLPPFGFVFPPAPDHPGYVRVTWGSGFRGHWGLNVGCTTFVDPYGDQSEKWQPGVYLWRAYRP